MILYRPKTKPSWRGRLLHAGEGAVLATLCGLGGYLLWHSWYQGVAFGSPLVVIVGFGWETATELINKTFKMEWEHIYGDILDGWSFIGGAAIIALPTGLLILK